MLTKIILLTILPVLFMFFNVSTQIIDETDVLLTEKWRISVCGSIISMSNITDDVICVSDIGNCFTCINKNYGNILFQKMMTDDYGLDNKTYIKCNSHHNNMLCVSSYLNNDSCTGWWLHINVSNGNLISKQEFMV